MGSMLVGRNLQSRHQWLPSVLAILCLSLLNHDHDHDDVYLTITGTHYWIDFHVFSLFQIVIIDLEPFLMLAVEDSWTLYFVHYI